MGSTILIPKVLTLSILVALVYRETLVETYNAYTVMAEPRVYSATKDAIDTQPVDYLDSLQKLGLTPKDSVTIKDPVTGAHRKVKGRFLHITDMHPDPYYKEGSDITGYQVCHGERELLRSMVMRSAGVIRLWC